MSTNAGPGPGPMEPTETGELFSRDGTALYSEWFATAAQPRALALILHGYAEHCGRYREVANVLNQAGVAALSYDMRGHGRAEGQQGHVANYLDYHHDMEAALEQLDDRANISYPGTQPPVILVSHSNGGLIAMRAMCDPMRVPRRLAAAVLSSPFLGLKLKVPRAKALISKAAARLVPTLSLANDIDIADLTHDAGKLAERRMDTLCHEVASAGWFDSALYTQKYVGEFAHRVTVPTLWLIAGEDRLADPAVARRIHQKVRAPTRYVGLPGLFHEVFNEVERELVFGHLTSFIDDRFPPS